MRTSYYYIFPLLLLLLTVSLPAQNCEDEKPADINKRLSQQNGPVRVKLLMDMARIYSNSAFYQPDSALLYAEEAFEYAGAINDIKGTDKAAALCANISLQLSLVNKGLKYYQVSREFAITANNQQQLVFATRGIGQALWYGGKFRQAVDTIQKIIEYFRIEGLKKQHSDATMVLSSIYSDMGYYEKAFEVAQQSLWLSQTSKDMANIILSLVQLGYLYKSVGDYSTALKYFNQAFTYKPPPDEWCYRHLSNRMGDLYCEQKKYDSAFYFYSKSLASHAESKTSLLRMADYWLAREQYQKAETYFRKVYGQLKNTGEGNLLVFSLVGLGKTSIANGDLKQALSFAYEALDLAKQRDSRVTLRDAYHLLYTVYDTLGRADSAYAFYKKYVAEKEAVISDQFKGKLFAYKQVSEIRMLKNENLLAEQKLEGNRLLRNILLGGIVMILFFGLVIFWNFSLKRKNEKLRNNQVQTALKQRAVEMEMQALRAQMNPHFIFNALSSVNRFILKNDPDKASDYLTRFSRLIRLVLINSQKELVLLEEEIEMLRLYLQMEQIRFKNAFEYTIRIAENIDPATISVPPLLLQPFCENAIWHGLMHSEEQGNLDIEFGLDNQVLQCIITDNGVGRSKAAMLASKSAEKIKSLGLQLTKERLALFNQENEMQTSFEIEDLTTNGKASGTRVKLQLKHQSFVYQKAQQAVC